MKTISILRKFYNDNKDEFILYKVASIMLTIMCGLLAALLYIDASKTSLFFVSVFVLGLAGVITINLINDFKSWIAYNEEIGDGYREVEE